MNPIPRLLSSLLVFLLTGCAAVQTRLHTNPPGENRALRDLGRETAPGATARPAYVEWLDYAQRTNLAPEARLQAWLETARAAFQPAWQGDASANQVYRRAVREVVECWQKEHWEELSLPALPGENRLRRLTWEHLGGPGVDPRRAADLLAASRVEVRGLLQHSATEGFGVPFIARFRQDDPALEGQPGVPQIGMAFPLNATLLFRGDQAVLRMTDTLRADTITYRGKTQALASDYSAALAFLITRGKNRLIDLGALFFSDRLVDQARLLQFQPYDPAKIPVVFVHGLLSRPEAWTQALNGLLADPVIRERYQFWFYLYPTGLPVWKSAAILRNELSRFEVELGRCQQEAREKILIGHSMGGLISSLLVREGGERLWNQFAEEPLEEVQVSAEVRQSIREMIYFGPRQDVSRVIFVATPHRGSPMALRPIAGFFAKLIRLPRIMSREDRQLLLQSIRQDMRRALVAPANSIRFLRARSPLLLSILELPLHGDIPVHSIIGNRGRPGILLESSDGVVPYWSSHLEGSVSEKIVPSGHGANEHPDGIEEMRRILREAVGQPAN
jgi:pimeloyl-ACP methyl ester carboxylesterase